MTDSVQQNVLIITRDQAVMRQVLAALAGRGVRGLTVPDAASALTKLDLFNWSLLIAELDALAGREWELLSAVKGQLPHLPIAALAAGVEVPQAVAAMKRGVNEFLLRPLSSESVETVLGNLLKPPAPQGPLPELIAGNNPQFLKTLQLARKVSGSSVPVLICGESGTGKELIAGLIHACSGRSGGPYIRVNCAALSETLLESELFGHEKGAFTGAVGQHKGRFERASGGTLLLDEISETGPRLQAELLRVLEQQDIERVGGREVIPVNVRIISTTNRNLAEEVAAGRFRSDLYYRIAAVELAVPPLRQRPDDIPLLVRHFVRLHAAEANRRISDIDPAMLAALQECHWPGNVRQLRNVIVSALVMSSGPLLSLAQTPWLEEQLSQPALSDAETLRLEELERWAIFEALRRTQSHQAKAAGLLGITDRTLREKLRRYRQESLPQTTGEKQWLTEPA